MKISRKTQYGLRALIFLAKRPKKIVSLKEISKKEGIPFHFLEKIFSKLERAKIVKAKKGLGGGYFLLRSPKNITLGEIFNALEEKIVLARCLSDEKYSCTKEKKCLAKKFWQNFWKTIYSTLNSVRLESLIKQ